MINITPLCKKYGRLPSSFLSKKVCRNHTNIKVEQGNNGFTKIPDELFKEFLMWVSPITRRMIVDEVDTSELLKELSDTVGAS